MNIFERTLDFSLDLDFIWPLVAFSVSLIISYFSHPVIIKVSKIKNLMAEQNFRSAHTNKTSNLGGIGIFLSIYLVVAFFGNYFQDQNLTYLLGAMSIMFFVGLVDDLISIRPKSKLIGQLIAAFSLILITDLRIVNLYGFIGIYELPYIFSILVTALLFLVIINAYNLIDGVDGLAGSFAIVVSAFFGYFFYVNGNYSMYFLSISIVGALISFLVFNFSTKNKLFMGDTGSMVVGFLLAYQSVNFMTTDFTGNFMITNSKSLVYFLAIFSFPLIDIMRVFFIRVKAGKSPFEADKNHIHHVLLVCGFNHKQISLMASIFTVTIVFGVYIFSQLEINRLVFVLVTMWFLSVIIIENFNLLTKLLKTNPTVIKEKNLESSAEVFKGKIIYMNKIA
jgi:UDP-N-acetylmuramyl pentapeptide phosphotransferase/UDP-N-acetylglucosamine-1-phosphate transferase